MQSTQLTDEFFADLGSSVLPIERYDFASAEEVDTAQTSKFSWNWKIMFENDDDGYHANKLHQGPLHDCIPSGRAFFPELPEDTGGYLRHNGTLHADASFNATQKAVLPIFPKLTDEDRHQVIFANIPPSLSLVLTSEMIIFLIVRATVPETNAMDVGELVAPGVQDDPSFPHRLEMIHLAASQENVWTLKPPARHCLGSTHRLH